MKVAAARAIAELADDKLSASYIVPSPLDPRVAPAVTAAVAAAVEAEQSGHQKLTEKGLTEARRRCLPCWGGAAVVVPGKVRAPRTKPEAAPP
jgi:malic enzyme